MSGHTPGKWGISAFNSTTVIAVSDGPDRHGREYRDGLHQVTISRSYAEDVPDLCEREANAKLFAAALETAAERDRLRSANEHWHVRVEALKTDIEAVLASRDRLKEVNAELVEQLKIARQLVEKWCHYQSTHPELFKQYLSPIDAVLDKFKEPPHD